MQATATVVLAALVAVLVLAALWRGVKPDVEAYRRRRRVCVLMFSTPNIVNEYAGIAARVNEAYATRHGYDFKHVVGRSRHAIPQWEKVRLVQDRLPAYDAVFWIDSDAVFNQHDTSLDRWLDDPADLVGCTDVPNGHYKINCGTLLIKNTPWCRRFVDAWWAKNGLPKYNQWANEQEALHDMITNDELRCVSAKKIKVEPVDAFNSNHAELAAGNHDTFVLHFMAMTSGVRRRELDAVATRLGV